MGPAFNDEALDHSDFAIRGMNAIASVNPHLTQGEGVMRYSLSRILDAVRASNPSP